MIAYRTEVFHIHPSPRGLVGDRWVIEHWCTVCRQRVTVDQLITHAQTHDHDHRGRRPNDKP